MMMVIGLLQTADKMAQKEPRAPMAVKMFITQPLDACHGRWDRAGKSVDFPFAVRVRTRPDSSPPRIPFRAGPAAVASCCGRLLWPVVLDARVRGLGSSLCLAEPPVCLVPIGDGTGFGAFGFVFSARSGFLRYSVGALRGADRDSPEGRAETTSLRDERLGTRKISRGHRLTGSKASLVMAAALCFRCAAPRNVHDQLPDGKPRKRKGYP
jgi:hypothetical protein